jgi:hypothetical protein
MLLRAKAGDVIWYFKKGGITINPEEIDIRKYKEMLMATVKDPLEILGYSSSERIEDLWHNREAKEEKGLQENRVN